MTKDAAEDVAEDAAEEAAKDAAKEATCFIVVLTFYPIVHILVLPSSVPLRKLNPALRLLRLVFLF